MIRPLILSLALIICACEPQSSTPDPLRPVDACQRVGQRCKLDNNQLGVCGAQDGGAQPGKLTCQSQH